MKKSSRSRLIPLYLLVVLVVLLNLRGGHHERGFPLSILGGAFGPLVGMQLGQLVTLLIGRAGGHALLGLSLGFGARLTEPRIGRLSLVVRRVPFPFLAGAWVVAAGPRLRPRLWLATLASTGVQVGLGLWLVIDDSARYFGLGMLLLPVMMLTWFSTVPLSPGWVLFRLPFLPERELEPYALTPDELAATTALRAGRVAEAAELMGPSTGFQSRVLRACLALARGNHELALAEAGRALTVVPHPKHAAQAQILLACALVGAAETGLLPPADYLPRLARAIETARTAQPMVARVSCAPADLALLEGRREEAVALARQAVGQAPDRLWLALAECSYAAALASLGRAEEARSALDRARAATPELARIALVERRIGLNTIEV